MSIEPEFKFYQTVSSWNLLSRKYYYPEPGQVIEALLTTPLSTEPQPGDTTVIELNSVVPEVEGMPFSWPMLFFLEVALGSGKHGNCNVR